MKVLPVRKIKNYIYAATLCFFAPSVIADNIQGSMQVYGDLTYHYDDETDGQWSSSIDLFGAYKIDDNDTVLFEVHAAKRTGHEAHFEGERWWWKHGFSEEVALSMGRFHTPLGHWNKSFHHGVYLQDTIDRPFYLDFEDDNGFMPIHNVGMNLSGELLSSNSTISYVLFLSNNQKVEIETNDAHGEGHIELIPQDDAFYEDDLLAGLNLLFKPEDRPYEYGIYFSTQTITGDWLDITTDLVVNESELYQQQILGLDFRGNWDKLNFTAEYHHLEIEDLMINSGKLSSDAGYLQIGYELNTDSKVIFRTSFLSYENEDSFYRLFNIKERSRFTMGYRYELTSTSNLKFQYSHNNYKNSQLGSDNEFALQIAFNTH